MPAHQRFGLEDNRGLTDGRAQPIEPDEDQAVCRAQPEPRWRRPLQDDKLLAEKCRFGLASRMRSEQSDEKSAEQLQEVKHPKARIADRGIYASPDTIFGSHRKCNALNTPSRTAATRLGFRVEGIFRQADVVKGRNRDTAWFSIIDREWPGLRAAFERWLDPGNFDETGRQRVSLSSLTARLRMHSRDSEI